MDEWINVEKLSFKLSQNVLSEIIFIILKQMIYFNIENCA